MATTALARANRAAVDKATAALAAVSAKEFSSSAMPAEVVLDAAVSDANKLEKKHFEIPEPLMMGPGPSNPYPRANDAMSKALLGHMHAPMFPLMDEIQTGLKYVLQTENEATFGLSASGGAAMDAAVSNLLEPGEKAVVSVSGIWGERFTEKCLRHGAEVVQIRKEAGLTPSFEEIEKVLEEEKPAVLFLCHGESSSGTKQKLDGVGELCHKHGPPGGGHRVHPRRRALLHRRVEHRSCVLWSPEVHRLPSRALANDLQRPRHGEGHVQKVQAGHLLL